MKKLAPRIQKHIRISRGCWNWTGQIATNGYGHVWYMGRTELAHRAVYKMLVGPIRKSLTIDHLCRNKRCVNPAHLEPVSIRVNILRGDGPAAINARLTKCKRGHPLSGSNLFILGAHRQRRCRICFNPCSVQSNARNREKRNAHQRETYRLKKAMLLSAHGNCRPANAADRARS